jgi:hypothetical protein
VINANKPNKNVMINMFFDICLRGPILLCCTRGSLVASAGGSTFELGFFFKPPFAVDVTVETDVEVDVGADVDDDENTDDGELRTFGHVFSFANPLSSMLVPSLVPSLISRNFEQVGRVIYCCCGTQTSGSFCENGFHGSASFCPNVNFDEYYDIPSPFTVQLTS